MAKKGGRGSALQKVQVSFKKVQDMTLGEVYGTKPIPVTQIAKGIWVIIKKKGLRVDK